MNTPTVGSSINADSHTVIYLAWNTVVQNASAYSVTTVRINLTEEKALRLMVTEKMNFHIAALLLCVFLPRFKTVDALLEGLIIDRLCILQNLIVSFLTVDYAAFFNSSP